jgi:hypothetical protein
MEDELTLLRKLRNKAQELSADFYILSEDPDRFNARLQVSYNNFLWELDERIRQILWGPGKNRHESNRSG